MTRRARRPTRWMAALAILALSGSGCGLSLQALPKPGGISGPSYQIKAVFANVLNLPVQAKVLIGANQVGQVSAITTADFQAHLTLTIKQGVQLPVGTTAQILFDSPLGDDFIELHPPAKGANGPYLRQGDVLPEPDTSSAPSIADTLAALGTLLNGGGLNQLQTIIVQLNDALDGHQGDIRTVLVDLQTVVTSLAANRGSIDSALAGLTQLSSQLAQGSAAISQGIDTIGPAVGVLADDNADFSRLLDSTNQLSTLALSVVNASGQAGVTDIKEIDGILNQLVSVEKDIGPTLADFSQFEKLTPRIAPGNYLQLSLTGNAIVGSAPVLGANSPSPTAGTSAAASTNGNAITGLLGAGLP